MPERCFRVTINNASANLQLEESFRHLCGGNFTPGGWTPDSWTSPGFMNPGESGGVQSENNGFMTGTEGYLKLDVNITPGGSRQKIGMIYVYWSNPYYGVTRFRIASALTVVTPDCDFTPPTGGSGFDGNNQAPLPFSIAISGIFHTENGTDVTDVSDLVTFGAGAAAGAGGLAAGSIFDFVGLLGIMKDPWLKLQFSDVASPPQNFGPPSADGVLKALADAGPDLWVGLWISESGLVKVDVTQSVTHLAVDVQDGSTLPVLDISGVLDIGLNGWISTGPLHSMAAELAANSAEQAALVGSVRQHLNKMPTILGHSPAASVQLRPSMQLGERGRAHLEQIPTAPPGGAATDKVAIIQKAADRVARDGTGVAYLDHGISLRMFGVFSAGVRTGVKLLFQRLASDGSLVTQVTLIKHIKIN